MLNIPKNAEKPAIFVSIVVLSFCVFSIVKGCGSGGDDFTKEQLQRLESTVGFSVQEIVDRLGDKTKVLLVSINVPGSSGLEESREVARTVLEKGGKEVVAEEIIIPVGEGQFFNPINWAISWEEFKDLVTRNPGTEAVVSIAGAPALEEGDEVILPDSYPGLYVAFSPGRQPALEELFDEQILKVAVVREPSPGDAHGETPRENFDKTFQVYTADSEELPIFHAMP
jgi:hypothetical protein